MPGARDGVDDVAPQKLTVGYAAFGTANITIPDPPLPLPVPVIVGVLENNLPPPPPPPVFAPPELAFVVT